jgi:hypothetical protein
MRQLWLVTLWLVMLATVSLISSTAGAQDKGKPAGRAPKGVITLAEVTITGRIQKPIAAVDVARIRPSLTLSELKQPFLKRVEAAIYKEPF